jgi:hypothetical protein
MTEIDTETVINHYVYRLNKSKWQVTFRADNGIQVKKLKQVNKLGVWSGLVLLPFWGIGFIIWLLVLVDYWLQQEKIMFISTDQMIKQFKKEAN